MSEMLDRGEPAREFYEDNLAAPGDSTPTRVVQPHPPLQYLATSDRLPNGHEQGSDIEPMSRYDHIHDGAEIAPFLTVTDLAEYRSARIVRTAIEAAVDN